MSSLTGKQLLMLKGDRMHLLDRCQKRLKVVKAREAAEAGVTSRRHLASGAMAAVIAPNDPPAAGV